jgi:DNA polymerase III subunit delta
MDMQPGESTETLPMVLSSIKQGDIAPCYLLYGEEEYLVQEALNKIIDLLLPPADRELNLFSVEGGQEDVATICQSLLTMPLLPGRKIVAVRNTILFQSRKILPSLIQKIRERLEINPLQAAGNFLEFLKLTGWKLADFQDEGWKRISDSEWQKTVEGDSGEDREKWLPKVVAICVERGLETASSAGDNLEGLSKVLAVGLPEGNHLLLTAAAVDKRKQIFKQISAIGKVLYFPRTKNEAKQKFLLLEAAQEFLDQKGKKLTPAAWEAIGAKTGFELRDSMLALEKLSVYTGGATTIDARDVEAVIGKTKEDTVFELTAALVEKKLPQALIILKDLLERGVHHLVIMKMLTREIRLLLYAQLLLKSGKLTSYKPSMDYNRFQANIYPAIKALGGKEKEGLGSLCGQHPYPVYLMLKKAGLFPYEVLIGHLEYLADMDLALRSTGRDPQLMLERFLAEVCLH